MRFYPTSAAFRTPVFRTPAYSVAKRTAHTADTHDFVPSADIAENEKGFTVWLALPGVKKSEVNLSVEQNQLIISGATINRHADDHTWHRRGIATGDFRKVFTLSEGLDTEGITAEFEDGLLKVWVPKAPEAQKRTISVQ